MSENTSLTVLKSCFGCIFCANCYLTNGKFGKNRKFPIRIIVIYISRQGKVGQKGEQIMLKRILSKYQSQTKVYYIGNDM